MNCRIIKKDEFIVRMLADQELRRQKRQDEQIRGHLAASNVIYDAITRSLRDRQKDIKRGRRA